MAPPSNINIAQLAALVEELIAQINALGEEAGSFAGLGEVRNPESGLTVLLARFWPEGGSWSSPAPGPGDISALARRNQERHEQAEAEIRRMRIHLDQMAEELEGRRRELDPRLDRAARAVSRAGVELARAHKASDKSRLSGEVVKREIAALKRWLEGIEPSGMFSYVDQHGGQVSQEDLAQARARLDRLLGRKGLIRRQGAELTADIALAGQGLEAALTGLASEEDWAQRARVGFAAERQRLRLNRVALDAERGELESLRQTGEKIHRLGLGLDNYLDLAGEILNSFWKAGGEEELDPAAALAESLKGAEVQAERAARLAGLLSALRRRLEKAKSSVGPVVDEVRAVNRMIKKFEKRLPGPMEPFASPDSAGRKERSRAAVELSFLLGELEQFLPRARAAQRELDRLKQNISLGLGRARAWQDAWRKAGRAEREFLGQAEALVEEVLLAAREVRSRQEANVAALAPAIRVLSRLPSPGLEPLLHKRVELLQAMGQRARTLEERAAEVAAILWRPTAGNLAKPPAAFKPFSVSLRRLKGKQVELARLGGLSGASRKLLEFLSQSLHQALYQPVRGKVRRLEGDLTRLSAQRDGLQEEQRALSRRILELNRKLDRTALAKQDGEAGSMPQAAKLDRESARLEGESRNLNTTQAQPAIAPGHKDLVARTLLRLGRAQEKISHLEKRLERSERLAEAFKQKTLAKRATKRRAHSMAEEVDWLRGLAHYNESQAQKARDEAAQVHQNLKRVRGRLSQMKARQKETQKRLAEEQAARVRSELDFLETKALSVELAAAQGEAARWAALAQDLSRALAVSNMYQQQETAELKAQVEHIKAEAAALQDQLGKVAQLVTVAGAVGRLAPVRQIGAMVRLTHMSPVQMDKFRGRLASVHRRLSRLGSSTLGHWAAITTVSLWILLGAPNAPSIATRNEAPLSSHRLTARSVTQRPDQRPAYVISSQARRVAVSIGVGGLEINLLPLRPNQVPLSQEIKDRVARLAREAGLSPNVLMTSARALYGGQTMAEESALSELVQNARRLACTHPAIFRELSDEGKPVKLLALAQVAPGPREARAVFLDRLYREYRSLGWGPEEALGALAANQRAIKALNKAWRPPGRLLGQINVVPAVERMDLVRFLNKVTPYIQGKLKVFMRQRGIKFTGDMERYAQNLAYDMYCAAKLFKVPVTFLLAIAHQETWYANVLGDLGRSASPFQIYEPTRALIRASMQRSGMVPPPKGIKLERHLTMATYMAAFHLRELMQRSYAPPRQGMSSYVNMDHVMLRYNGSSKYSGLVASRQRALARSINRKPR